MKIKLSKKQWELIGKQAQWDKQEPESKGGYTNLGPGNSQSLPDAEYTKQHGALPQKDVVRNVKPGESSEVSEAPKVPENSELQKHATDFRDHLNKALVCLQRISKSPSASPSGRMIPITGEERVRETREKIIDLWSAFKIKNKDINIPKS